MSQDDLSFEKRSNIFETFFRTSRSPRDSIPITSTQRMESGVKVCLPHASLVFEPGHVKDVISFARGLVSGKIF